MKHPNTQKGFGVVGIIIILAGLVVLGFVGWRVWEANRVSSPDRGIGSESTTNPEPSHENAYIHPSYGFIFNYPNQWVVDDTTRKYGEAVNITAPDTLTSEEPIGGYTTQQGAVVMVFVQDCNVVADCTVGHAYDGIYANAANRQVMQVDGVEAVRFTFAYEGQQALYTVFFKDSKKYILTLTTEGEESSSVYLSTYEAILRSFRNHAE
jgi:hypothetical protein